MSHIRADVADNIISESKTRVHVPVYIVLGYLHWPSRFPAFAAFKSCMLEPYHDVIDSTWARETMLREHFMVIPLKLDVKQESMPDTILHPIRPISWGVKTVSVVVYKPGENPCVYISSEPQGLGSDFLARILAFSKREKLWKHFLKRVQHRAINTPLIPCADILDFVNGECSAFVMTGDRRLLTSFPTSILREVVDRIEPLLSWRDSSLERNSYTCSKQTTVLTMGNGTQTRHLCNSRWPPTITEIERVLEQLVDTAAYICIEFKLTHRYTVPREGQHENTLSFILQPTTETQHRTLARDTFIISRSLSSWKVGMSPPYRESIITRYLLPFNKIHVLVGMS
jgi:hypothetical protein